MKRFAVILFVALAVSTAFAQAQRWEYATLLLPQSTDASPIFTAPGVGILGWNPVTGTLSRDRFLIDLRRYAGAPEDHDEKSLAAMLSLLGLQRWELILTTTNTSDGLTTSWFYFKRPLLE